jgi:hypothetical protein
MPIKSTIFGHVELSGKEAERFIQHMNEDKPNPAAQESLGRGRELMKKIAKGAKFTVQSRKKLPGI